MRPWVQGAGLLLLVLIGGVAGFLLYTRLILGIGLRNQPALLQLPPEIMVNARATHKLPIRLRGTLDAAVPIRQTIALPLAGTYAADVVMDAKVPLRFNIRYQGQVPVRAYADVNGTTDLVFKSVLIPKFKLKVRVPLDFILPVKLDIPVDTELAVNYRGPVQLTLDQTVAVPVDTVLHTRLKLDRDVEAPILANFNMRVRPPAAPLSVRVLKADLGVALRGLRLERASNAARGTGADATPATVANHSRNAM